ncbi:MAG: hypothetical protein J0M17_11370 [Planctomycetes bacterium]|nr:hypothetical protein [Planctomycetota bacterium]
MQKEPAEGGGGTSSRKAIYAPLRRSLAVAALVVLSLLGGNFAGAEELRIGVFNVDATPPIGSPVAYAPALSITDPLYARGVVLLGVGRPIVLCAVDWIGIYNSGHDVFREALAKAVDTTVDRVAVHTLHQHDGPRCDFGAEELLAPHGLAGKRSDVVFNRRVIAAAAQAAKDSLAKAQRVTQLGVGEAKVDKVASNRRLLGPDGRVAISRSSSYRIPQPILGRLITEAHKQGYQLSAERVEEALAAPEGVIDPFLKMITFYDGDAPIVSLSYYATHPQSFFGEGDVTSEFVGLARAQHESDRDGATLVHFNGAAGNIAAGKYNDGTPKLRIELTKRMADGMQRAWRETKVSAIAAEKCEWRVAPVQVPVAAHLKADELRATLADEKLEEGKRSAAAGKLSFVLRRDEARPIELSCLKLGDVYLVHMPGELFVEYQLAAQKLRPDGTVCMAAYGDGGTGYIGTEIAYEQGGYETQPSSSNTAPQVEKVLMDGIKELLK